MKVIEINSGAWFKLKKGNRIFYSILCQIGQGSNELMIEWTDYLQQETQDKSITCDQLLEHILYHYNEYDNLQVSELLRMEIETAISKFNESSI